MASSKICFAGVCIKISGDTIPFLSNHFNTIFVPTYWPIKPGASAPSAGVLGPSLI
ncbi:MAG: hypothetical protein NTY72_00840 [Bacteroidetes bacterium]|nr:hypothetical protein [Bacteroidota bacterium]